MNRLLLTLAATATSMNLMAANMDTQLDEARSITKAFGSQLQGVLKPAMKQEGAVAAIDVCNTQAAPIASEQAQTSGWGVGRTSLKVRNRDNLPDAWERSVLEQFEQRLRAGESPASLEVFETVDTEGGSELRYMKAIPTAAVCLNCHGSQLAPEVAARIDTLYPQDRARGFSEGDLRGAFSLRKHIF
ncbi:Tll0287-like domain-containing protein [Aestuariirhabdus sp. LZHN29]|uniref:Tll0287-like domain-containing protein n=1 Tax=Aestuariirhabdus sp. LZHN29 TaxID=3417462 RepID=UPI003CF81800